MNRMAVFRVIDDERDFQVDMAKTPERPDIIPTDEFEISGMLLAMEHNLRKAKEAWYSASPESNYQESMHYIRKVAALAVQAGEKYGMPYRKLAKS